MASQTIKAKSGIRPIRSIIPYLLAASSFICAALVGYELMTNQEKSQTAYIAGLVAAATGVASALYQRSREIETDRQSAELVGLQVENQKLIAELKQTLTGGDSFAVVYFPVIEGKRMMTIRNFGDNPLTDIRITIMKFEPLKHIDGLIYPTLPPRAVEPVKPVTLQFDKRFPLQIDFTTLNNSWSQTLICAKANEEIVFALTVWKFDVDERGNLTRVTLHEEVHPKFPRDSNGDVDWSVGKVDLSGAQPVLESREEMLSKQLGMG